MNRTRILLAALLFAAAPSFAADISTKANANLEKLKFDSSGNLIATITGSGGTCGALGGDLTGTCASATVAKINGTSAATSSAADQVLRTTASGVASWATLASCSAATSAVTYDTTTHAWGCNTISSGLVSGTTAIGGGVDTAILYNDAGTLKADATSPKWDKTTGKVTITGSSPGLVTPNVTGATDSADLNITSGTTVNGDGGYVSVGGTSASGSGDGGSMELDGGSALGAGSGGDIGAFAGSSDTGLAGAVDVFAGSTNAGTHNGGNITLGAGNSAGGDGGKITLATGFAPGGIAGIIDLKIGLEGSVLQIGATGDVSSVGADRDLTMSGTIDGQSGFAVNGAAGVSCTVGLLNPLTAVITNGIVTHC